MTIDLSDVQFDVLLKRLHLANTRRAWRDLVQHAERDEWSYRDFLALLVSEEIAHRQQTRIARMVRRAHFPFFKTIDDFNFTYQSTVRLSLLGSALAADFVTEGRCLIFGGKPGRGKTHLAVAIAYRAIQQGFDALFVTAAELIDDLSGAFRRGQLADALARYVHPAVIVIDEVGYLTYGTDAANMLFHVVNDRHRKKRAMIVTTNKPLTAWGRVLHDEDLAHAIVDRILERGRMLTLDGPSMRTRHLGIDDATSPGVSAPPARISGIDRPEFPEPTDADLQDPPELLAEMMTLMDQDADVVYGQRVSRAGETWRKKTTAHLFYRLLRKMTDVPIPADTGDFRLISRRALLVLQSMPEQHRFIRGMVSWMGFRQVPLRYNRAERFAGETHYPLWKMIRLALDAITGFSTQPLRLSLHLGFVLGLTSAALLVYTFISWLYLDVVHGWTSLMAVVLMLGSAQMLLLGIMGEYLGRLYMQSKQRPLFVIADIARNRASIHHGRTGLHRVDDDRLAMAVGYARTRND